MKARNLFVILWVAFVAAAVLAGPGSTGVDAGETLTRLKALEGGWRGADEGAEGDAASDHGSRHEFRVSAVGSVVMETMFPGTDHEMINMYHIDGEDLVLTHYCAMGNQPRMRLDRAASSAERLVFAFDGGTNFDPSKDAHIHSATLTFTEGGLISEWTSWDGGKLAGSMKFELARE